MTLIAGRRQVIRQVHARWQLGAGKGHRRQRHAQQLLGGRENEPRLVGRRWRSLLRDCQRRGRHHPRAQQLSNETPPPTPRALLTVDHASFVYRKPTGTQAPEHRGQAGDAILRTPRGPAHESPSTIMRYPDAPFLPGNARSPLLDLTGRPGGLIKVILWSLATLKRR